MPANFVLLEKITVGAAGASSITFSGIPQTGYTDLVVKVSMRTEQPAVVDTPIMRFNGATTNTNLSTIRLMGNGSTASSSNPGAGLYLTRCPGASATASTFGNIEVYIPNYTSSAFKSVSIDQVSESNTSTVDGVTSLMAGLWSSTSAINSVTILSDNAATITANSTFYLYGVAKLGTTPAIVPYATGGDTIMTDGTYWYHTFLSSGTFTPQKAISCDYLVVAGGGGGGYDAGGGGGAGGYKTSIGGSALSLGTSAYTVTIGAGGAAGTVSTRGSSGSNSVFSTITSTGGGGAGTRNTGIKNGLDGGSGGGGAGDGSTGGAASPSGQGSAGGNGNASFTTGAGGGGAGAVGANATGEFAASLGGNGLSNSITGTSVTYAGGGGGGKNDGAGGSGGGGKGGGSTASVAGTANTGGGGGGGNNTGVNISGAAGGSGIVVVRYLV
jgi:hypothetical protein